MSVYWKCLQIPKCLSNELLHSSNTHDENSHTTFLCVYFYIIYIYMCVYRLRCGQYMSMCFGFRHRVDNVIVVICHHRFYLSYSLLFFFCGIAICLYIQYTCIFSLIIYVICTLEFQPIETPCSRIELSFYILLQL